MIEKVKLPRDVAEVIERYRGLGCTNEGFVHDHIKSGIYHVQDAALSGFNLDTLIRALYIGYEVETTPEEKVYEWFKAMQLNKNSAVTHVAKSNYDIMMTAGLQILECLGIKIKGVND